VRTGRLPRSFFARDPLVVGPDLLGKLMVHGDRSLRIVEVEAYRGRHDPASHARRGITARNQVMFGPPGHWYVYFTYGMHWCANVVCGAEGEAAAVLVRAGHPVTGLEAMYDARRVARRDIDLCSGPAKLCQALDVDGRCNGTDAIDGDLRIADDHQRTPGAVVTTGRIGVSDGAELPWRWLISDNPHVSHRPSRGPGSASRASHTARKKR
jgi:DNA-3-methyladenine glycosylase